MGCPEPVFILSPIPGMPPSPGPSHWLIWLQRPSRRPSPASLCGSHPATRERGMGHCPTPSKPYYVVSKLAGPQWP